MAQHKWAKEIKAWANGFDIEWSYAGLNSWTDNCNSVPNWSNPEYEFRIKKKPRPPKYIYVYWGNDLNLGYHYFVTEFVTGNNSDIKLIGKIKLEQE